MSDRPTRPAVRCRATNHRTGKQCGRWANRGATVCGAHGGNTAHVKAKAAIRYELMQWRLEDATDDPVTTLLRLLTQARRRADRYSAELQEVSARYDTLQEALVGDARVVAPSGDIVKVGEYIRGLVQLEAQERDRVANYSKMAIQANVMERRDRREERLGADIAQLLRKLVASPEVGLSASQQDQFLVVISRELQSLPEQSLSGGGGIAGPEAPDWTDRMGQGSTAGELVVEAKRDR